MVGRICMGGVDCSPPPLHTFHNISRSIHPLMMRFKIHKALMCRNFLRAGHASSSRASGWSDAHYFQKSWQNYKKNAKIKQSFSKFTTFSLEFDQNQSLNSLRWKQSLSGVFQSSNVKYYKVLEKEKFWLWPALKDT